MSEGRTDGRRETQRLNKGKTHEGVINSILAETLCGHNVDLTELGSAV